MQTLGNRHYCIYVESVCKYKLYVYIYILQKVYVSINCMYMYIYIVESVCKYKLYVYVYIYIVESVCKF